MPTYQYACTACDERLEAVQSFTDAPLAECPACGGALRKVFSAVGVVFKGSGFYKTDSRTKSPAGKSDAKTDSKTDSKTGSTGSSGDKSASSTPAAASTGSSSSSSTPTPASKTA